MIRCSITTALAGAFIAAAMAANAGSLELIRSYAVERDFVDDDGAVAGDLSGFACTALPARRCLAINDQNRSAQFAAVEDGRIIPGDMLPLIGAEPSAATRGTAPQVTTCPGGPKSFKDLDGEAVAYAAPHFYVVGSHGCGRNNDAFRLSGFILARIRVDAEARPVDPQGNLLQSAAAADAVETTYRLADLLKQAPALKDFFGQSLNQKNGLNIEGLAVAGDRLLAGLRGPAKDTAFILSASVADLFAPGQAPSTATPEVFPVALGANTGIRDLAPLGERLLVLAGPTQEQPEVPYGLFLFEPKPGARPLPVAPIPDVIEGGTRRKAEALTILDAQGDELRILVMFDGPKNGGPREYRVSLK
jgi:uncharacterized protein DUF3616